MIDSEDSDLVLREQRQCQVKMLSAQGLTVHQIARRLYVSYRTVQRDRRVLGISGTPPQPYGAQELVAIRAMLDEGMSYAEVSRNTGRAPRRLRELFPGYSMSPQEVGRYAAMGRWFAHSDREARRRTA